MFLNRLSRTTLATLIALLFHTVGLAGIFTQTKWVIEATAFNLLLSAGLLIWTHNGRDRAFWLFALICYATGLLTEIIGVNTGLLFGDYQYGQVLGPQLASVPLVIGINWFIVQYCCGHTLLALIDRLLPDIPARMKSWSLVVDGAILAVVFDWLIEPVAVKLGYWTWNGGEIPSFNYLSWLVISLLLMLVFRRLQPGGTNKFAVHLLLIQALFFLILRTFY
jgi:putative membrane protein